VLISEYYKTVVCLVKGINQKFLELVADPLRNHPYHSSISLYRRTYATSGRVG
jgi:hypothetical protein